MYSSTSITEHLELFRFTLSFCKEKKKKKSLPTYPKFLDLVGRGQTNIFLNAALVSFFPCYSGMLGNPFNNPVLLNGPHLNTDGISERALFCC